MNKEFSKIVKEIDFQNNFLKEVFGNIDIDYNSKRFNKYIKKLEDNLFVYLTSFNPCPFVPNDKKVKDLEELVFDIINTYFYAINLKINNQKEGYSPLEMANLKNICSMFNLYFFDSDDLMFEIFLNNFNWGVYQDLITNYKVNKGAWNFNDIYKQALVTTSKNNIKRKAGEFFISKETTPIDGQNYFLTLPSKPMDYINIFTDILNLIKVDIIMLCNKSLISNCKNFSENNFINKLNQQMQEKQEEIEQYYNETMKNLREEALNEFSELQEEYKLMVDELNNLDSLKNKLSINTEVISNQNDTIKKLMKENNKLKEKYNNLVSKINISEELQEKKEVCKEIDINLNYVFLASEDITFKDGILNVFPNSKIISNNKANLNPNNIDYVIVLTNHIGHAEYYGVKEQCKNKNIPFLHCPFDNIQMIKELIYENINV